MIPSYFKIKILVKCRVYCTMGAKGWKVVISVKNGLIIVVSN